jgi:hypothetical protein
MHNHLHMQSLSVSGVPPLRWRKSTASNPNGNCVELAEVADGLVALRNSRYPAGPVVVGSRAAVAAFVCGARDGEFDDLVSDAAAERDADPLPS